MRTRLLNVLLLAALVFAVSRLWQFLGEPPPVLPAVNAAAVASAGAGAKREKPAPVVEIRPEAYDVIVARDLFSPARGVVPPAPATASKPAPRLQPPPKLTLSGVVIIDGEKTAYLQEGTQESRPQKVRENQNFAGGIVKSIRPDGITFVFADTEIIVPLRTPKDGGGAAPVGKALGGAIPRSDAPVAFPRRTVPTGLQPGQMPISSRPMPAAPAMPALAPAAESGNENFGDDEMQEGSTPGGEIPGANEEEPKE